MLNFKSFVCSICMLMCLLPASSGWAQDLKKVHISSGDITLKQLIKEIENQTEYTFVFDNTINLSQKLTIKKEDNNIENILKQAFENTDITFEISGKQIILKKRASATDTGKRITGKIVDESGEGVIGANVKVVNTAIGTISNKNGEFVLNVPVNSTLEVSFIGYGTQNIYVGNKQTLNVTLKEDNKLLNEVVVIGYGSSRKRDLTGSISTVESKSITGQTVQNVAQALQGKVAGVQVTNTGDPGSAPQIRIRGLGTVTDGCNPLFVVDGVIVDNINYLGPNDIENISILKDASSAAIYGVRAAGGVVIVTTKHGTSNTKPTVTFNTYMGYKKASNLIKMANGAEYITLYNEKMEQIGDSRRLNASDYTSHNYFDDIFAGSWTNSEDLGVTGGSDNSRYSFGLTHLKENGLVDKNNFSKIGLRTKYDVDITKHFRAGISVIVQAAKSNPVNTGVILDAYKALPIYAPKKADGTWTDPNVDNISGTMPNPSASLYYDYQWQTKIDGIVNAYLEADVLKSFTLKTDISFNPGMSNYIYFTPIYYVTEFQNSDKNNMSKSRNQNLNLYWDNTLTYSKKIGDSHNLKVMIGTSYQSTETDYLYAAAQGLKDLPKINHSYLFLSMPRIDEDYSASVSDDGNKDVSVSYMGRISYDYKNKYLINATLRRDGSTKFPSSNRWGWFPSVGLGWVMSEESFMKQYNNIDFLKLRASWGIIGNGNIPSNIYVPTIDHSDYYAVVFGNGQNTGNGKVMYPGTVTNMYNPNLKWETVHELNAGVDLRMFKSRFSATVDFYSKDTKNAVFPLTNLGSSGLNSDGVWGNNATINNTGLEISLGWNNITSYGLQYAISGNFTYNHNELKKINANGANGIYGKYDDSDNITYSTLGNPIGTFYGYKAVGVFQNEAQIESTPHLPGSKPGDLIYADLNKDKVIDELDRTQIGDPNIPFFYGFDANVAYKGFDASISIQGVAGNDLFNANRMFRYGTENFDKDFVNHRWHGENTSNSYPSASWSNPTTPSSFYVESGSYLRVKSIQLGYSLPASLLTKLSVKKLRIYLNAENPFTLTKYNGFSPEVGGSPLMTGVDRNTYPLSSVYSIGLNLSF